MEFYVFLRVGVVKKVQEILQDLFFQNPPIFTKVAHVFKEIKLRDRNGPLWYRLLCFLHLHIMEGTMTICGLQAVKVYSLSSYYFIRLSF